MAMVKQAIVNSTFDIDVSTYYNIKLSDGIYHMNNRIHQFISSHYYVRTDTGRETCISEKLFGEALFSDLETLKKSIEPLLITASLRPGYFRYAINGEVANFIIEHFTKSEVTSFARVENRRARNTGDSIISKESLLKAKCLDIKIKNYKRSLSLDSFSLKKVNAALPYRYQKNKLSNDSSLYCDKSILVGVEISQFSNLPNIYRNVTRIHLEKDLIKQLLRTLESKISDYTEKYEREKNEYLTNYPVDSKLEDYLKMHDFSIENKHSSYYVEDYETYQRYGSLFISAFDQKKNITLKDFRHHSIMALPFNGQSKPDKWKLLPEVFALA